VEPQEKQSEFSVAELQRFQELRVNTIIERIASHRDTAFNNLAAAEADVRVTRAQLELVSTRLAQARVVMSNFSSRITELEQQILELKALQKESVPEVPENLESFNPGSDSAYQES